MNSVLFVRLSAMGDMVQSLGAVRALRHGGKAEMDLARARRDLELVEEIYGQAPAGAPA